MLKSLPLPARLRPGNDPIQTLLYVGGGALLAFVAFIAVRNVVEGLYRPDNFLQGLVLGLAQGSIYALIALGYTLVYGVLQMINFAHSEVFMSGAYIAFFSINSFDQAGWLDQSEPGRVGLTIIALLVTLAVGMLTSTVVAVLLERIAYRPLRNAPRLVPLITAIGASIALQQIFLQLFGSAPRNYPVTYLCIGGVIENRACTGSIDILQGRYEITMPGGVIAVHPLYLVIFFAALLLIGVLWFAGRRANTVKAKAVDAAADRKNALSLLGIPVNRAVVRLLTLGALITGLVSMLLMFLNRHELPFTDFQPGFRAFAALRDHYEIAASGGTIIVRPLYFVVFITALILMSSLWFFVQRTKTGKAMRAVAEDKSTASLMGINVDRVIVLTFVLGALMAGAAAVLFALYNRQVSPFTGFQPGIKAFTAAVLGGIGNIPGAMAGGVLLGIVESAAPGMLGLPTQLEDVVAFSVLVLILIFRPTGIFGEVLAKKKA